MIAAGRAGLHRLRQVIPDPHSAVARPDLVVACQPDPCFRGPLSADRPQQPKRPISASQRPRLPDPASGPLMPAPKMLQAEDQQR